MTAIALGFSMTHNVTNLSGVEPDKPEEGYLTVSDVGILMEAYYYPGGSITEEDFENGKNVYTVTTEGEVTDKNGKSVWLKTDDLDRIAKLHTKFMKGKVKQHKGLICDYPSYVVKAFWEGDSKEYTSDANGQCDEVEEVVAIISPYFND